MARREQWRGHFHAVIKICLSQRATIKLMRQAARARRGGGTRPKRGFGTQKCRKGGLMRARLNAP
jgi:hypothetical protein